MSLIHDPSQILRFRSLLGTLEPHEALFLSLSARNKYLSREERSGLDLGRSEMFGRKIVAEGDPAWYLAAVRQYDTPGGWLSRGGHEIPSKCLVVYANINPLDGFKALFEFQNRSLELTHALLTDTDGSARKKLARLPSMVHNAYQVARSRRIWTDVDFDIDRKTPELFSILLRFLETLRAKEVKYHVIATHGGFHVLLRTETIGSWNYHRAVQAANQDLLMSPSPVGEIVINHNAMVPLPGTMQADYPVHFEEAL